MKQRDENEQKVEIQGQLEKKTRTEEFEIQEDSLISRIGCLRAEKTNEKIKTEKQECQDMVDEDTPMSKRTRERRIM